MGVRYGRGGLAGLLAVATLGCAPAANLLCLPGEERALPVAIPETSGVVWSSGDPAVFWTVNDGPEGVLFAVDTTGAEVGRVETVGSPLRDVEELSAGDCGTGRCLYLADVGDNQEQRDVVAIHRLPEPVPDQGSAERTAFPFRYPDGPRDVEAVFVLPGEEVFLVSKGRTGPPTLYRYPPPLRADSVVVVERLHPLGSGRPSPQDRVTGAAAVPESDMVLVRSYGDLRLYRMAGDRLLPVDDGAISLGSLLEPQGEAVAADAAGRILLTSEAGPFRGRSGMRLLRCELAEGG